MRYLQGVDLVVGAGQTNNARSPCHQCCSGKRWRKQFVSAADEPRRRENQAIRRQVREWSAFARREYDVIKLLRGGQVGPVHIGGLDVSMDKRLAPFDRGQPFEQFARKTAGKRVDEQPVGRWPLAKLGGDITRDRPAVRIAWKGNDFDRTGILRHLDLKEFRERRGPRTIAQDAGADSTPRRAAGERQTPHQMAGSAAQGVVEPPGIARLRE
jgi:hypothetical protein